MAGGLGVAWAWRGRGARPPDPARVLSHAEPLAARAGASSRPSDPASRAEQLLLRPRSAASPRVCPSSVRPSLSQPRPPSAMNQVEPGVQYNYVYDEDEYMLQEEEWDRDLLLDPAWEKQQRKVSGTCRAPHPACLCPPGCLCPLACLCPLVSLSPLLCFMIF